MFTIVDFEDLVFSCFIDKHTFSRIDILYYNP